MPAPLGKKVVFPSAHRPWLIQEASVERPVHKETPKEIREREICLNCKLPECRPDGTACPIAPLRVPSKGRVKPPDEFLDWAWGPMTNAEWADKCGVSVSTIQRWRQHYARQIWARRKKRQEDNRRN